MLVIEILQPETLGAIDTPLLPAATAKLPEPLLVEFFDASVAEIVNVALFAPSDPTFSVPPVTYA